MHFCLFLSLVKNLKDQEEEEVLRARLCSGLLTRNSGSNSQNFLIKDEVIITGYGFTDEDDFVYMLDRHTGEVLQSVSVLSKPEYFFLDGERLYVRCYDSDCVFSIN